VVDNNQVAEELDIKQVTILRVVELVVVLDHQIAEQVDHINRRQVVLVVERVEVLTTPHPHIIHHLVEINQEA
jgi:hypothetical protein